MKNTHLVYALFVLLAAGAPFSAGAQGIDTTTLRLQGARSNGAMLLPSAKVLDRLSWDLSLSYGHEGAVVRTEVPTGVIRGRVRSESVDWIESRDSMFLQFAFSPADRLELTGGMPLLLGQTGSRSGAIEAPQADGSAMGDPRLGIRYGVFEDAAGAWRGTVQAGLLLPGGGDDYAAGESRARADFSATAGYESPDRWAANLLVGHRMGERFAVGDQLFGDAVYAGGSVLLQHDLAANTLQWSLEALLHSVVAPADAGRDPQRTSLEFLGGARYFLPWFYADVGTGISAMTAGSTPAWRVLASLGTTGSWAAAAESRSLVQPEALLPPEPEPAPAPVAEAPPAPVVEAEKKVDIRGVLRAAELERQVVFFDTGKAELDATAERTLRSIAILLLETEGRIRITGYADDQGAASHNDALSLQRAEAVRAALAEAGIAADRLAISGAGDRAPVAQATGFGRSINRRVMFAWVESGE